MDLLAHSIPKNEIAFDIDGVIVNTMELILYLAKEKLGREYTYDQLTEYDVAQCLDISEEDAIAIYMDILSDDHNHRLELLEGAKPVMQKLARVTGKLLFITARHYLGNFKSWLCSALDVPEDKIEIIGTGGFEAKLKVLEEYGKKYMVEDRLETCFILAEGGITPLLFEQPWNRKPNDFMDVDWAAIDSLIDYRN